MIGGVESFEVFESGAQYVASHDPMLASEDTLTQLEGDETKLKLKKLESWGSKGEGIGVLKGRKDTLAAAKEVGFDDATVSSLEAGGLMFPSNHESDSEVDTTDEGAASDDELEGLS